MKCHFYLKEFLTNYGCSDLGIWWMFSLKQMNNCFTTDKIKALKKNLELEFWKNCIFPLSVTLSFTAPQSLKTFFF